MLIISFRPAGLFEQSGWWNGLRPYIQFTLYNYKELFSGGAGWTVPSGLGAGGALDSLRTSLEIVIPTTILVIAVSATPPIRSSSAAGGAQRRLPDDSRLDGGAAAGGDTACGQRFPRHGRAFSWNPFGTIEGVVIFHVAFGLPFGIFLMRNFFLGIPKDLIEAGRVDGAGEWTLFRKVVIPIGVAAAASLAIFQFIWTWNDLLVALVILGADPHVPITLFIYGQERTLAANFWIISTGSIVSIIIPLGVFLAFQKYFVRGVLAGAVK